jgi:hypothetical protein
MAETNAQRKKRRIIPNTLAETPRTAITEQATFQQQPSTTSELARTTAGGLRQLESIGQNVLGFGGAVVGADEFAEERLAAGREAQAEAAKLAPRVGRVEDIRTTEGLGAFAEDATDFVIGIAGQQGPIFGATLLGGIGGVGARAAAPAAIRKRVSAPVAGAVGAVGTGIGLETGSIFGDIANDPESRENLSLREIAGISGVGGVLAGSLEALPVLSIFRRFNLGKSAARSIRGDLAKRIGKGAAGQALLEGGTEGVQTIIERAAAKFANENREILGEEGISEILNASVAGFVLGGPIGAVSGGFQKGSIEDQLDIEESLDELETTGGTSSSLDADLNDLGPVGVDIRASRFLVSETELATEPERVIERILAARVDGKLPTSRSFAQLVDAVGRLENPAQLSNILAESGIDPAIREELATALQEKAGQLEEEHISLAVDERPVSEVQETGPEEFGGPGGFQSPNVSKSFIFRNRNKKLGFIESNNPLQENALRNTLKRLETDFPDISFDVVGLGDAIFEGLSPLAKETEAKANQALRSVAQEKLAEPGFNAAKFAPLDPNDPRAFLNQFKAIKKEEVNVVLSGRDQFRLTDSDLGGATRKTEVQVGGPVTKLDPRTKKPIGTQRAKTTVAQPSGRPIFVDREVSKDGDFNVDNKGNEQTVDAIALTNRMLSKREGEKAGSVQEIADAFFTGITALQQRGVKIGFSEGGLPDSLIIHKKPGVNGRIITWGQVKVKGAMRIRARIAAFKEHEIALLEKIKKINKDMQSSNIGAAGKKSMQRQVKKLQRRVKKIPSAIETLNIFGQSVSRDVQDLTRRLNDASELEIALGNEAEGLSDIAIEIQEIRRQLDREGFNTQASEELSDIGDELGDLDDFATGETRARRERTAPEGSLEAGEGESLTATQAVQEKFDIQKESIAKFEEERKQPAPQPRGKAPKFSAGETEINLAAEKELILKRKKDIDFSAMFTRGMRGLRKPGAEIGITQAVQDKMEVDFAAMTKKLNLDRARIETGENLFKFVNDLDIKHVIEQFAHGTAGGFTFSIDRNAPGVRQATLDLFGDDDHIVIINPFLNDDKFIIEVLAHEVGHIAFKSRFLAATPEVQNQIWKEFMQWRSDQLRQPNTPVGEVLATKQAFNLALEAISASRQPLDQLDDAMFDYVLDFEEWFADNTAKWFNPSPSLLENMTVTEEFFKSIADAFKELYQFIIDTFDHRPAPTVEAFLNDLVNHNAELQMARAKESVISGLSQSAAKVVGTDNTSIAAVFQNIDPFSSMTNYTVREVMQDNMEPDERATLFKYFNRRSVKTKLKRLLDDPAQQALIENSPLHAAVFGYQMWIAGTFKLTTPSQEQVESAGEFTDVAAPIATSTARLIGQIFQGLFDALAGRLGFVYESEEAAQILDAIRDSTFAARRAGTREFSVIKAVRGDVLQRVAQTTNDAFEHIKPFFDKAIGIADSRMLDSGIPSLIQIAQIFHARTGGEGQATTFFEARTAEIGKFMNSYTRITAELQKKPGLKKEVLRLLRNPGKASDPTAIAHASAIRKLLRRVRNYMEAGGVEIGDRGKNYFPWVFDPRKVQDNSDWFRNILADKRFDPEMEGIRKKINERIIEKALSEENLGGTAKLGPKQVPITKDQLIERMMMGLEQSEGLSDVNLNPSQAGTVPFFAAMNKRTLGFLTESGKLTASEREFFDSLFSDQLDLVMMTYIRQGVKRTEYTKRAGVRSEKILAALTNAVTEGATAAEMRMAHSYIDAMTGVIGEGTNNRIAQVLGLATRQGEVINPHWRTFTSIAMVLQNLAVLPLATFTSLVDPVGILVRSQDLNATMAALRTGATEIVAEVKLLVGGDEKKARSELRKLAEGMGTIEDHMTNEALEWEYGSTYLTPRLKATNEWFFKAIGLSQWTRVTRLMALAGGKEFIKRHVQRPNQNSERFLKQLNLDPADVKFDEQGNIRILTRLEREGDSFDSEELARDDNVRNALNRFVDESILRPNAAQRPIWASDPNYALVFHLKSFMFSFHDRILRRVFQEAELGNMAPLVLLSVFIPAMIMADVLRDFVQFGMGGNPRKAKWGLLDYIWSGAERSGVNGISQLLIDARQDIQFGGFGYESLSGPTIDGITDLGGLFSSDDEAQWNAATRNLPGQAAWKHWMENGLDES